MRNLRAELDAQMREVLAQLSTCSHVPAAPWQPTGRSRSSDEPLGGSRPPGDLGEAKYARMYGPPFHERTRQYPGCVSDEQRQAVLEQARDELKHIRGQYDRGDVTEETLEERNRRIVKEGEGFSVKEVALRFRTGERDVRNARTAAGREPETGLETESVDRDRIRELHDQGRTISSLAKQFGVHRSTIERYVGKRAA